MSELIQKLANLIRWGQVTNPSADTTQYPQTQMKYFDKVKDMAILYPYGMSANAPLNNLAVVWNVGHEENSIGTPMSEDNRPKGLKPGESVFGNWVVGTKIKFNSDGQ